MRRHLRIDGKAVRGAARGGRAPMLLSGIWDDGTTAAQLPVDVKKTNKIPVFRDLLQKPASFTCTRSRTSPPSSAPITATLTSSRCSFSAS